MSNKCYQSRKDEKIEQKTITKGIPDDNYHLLCIECRRMDGIQSCLFSDERTGYTRKSCS